VDEALQKNIVWWGKADLFPKWYSRGAIRRDTVVEGMPSRLSTDPRKRLLIPEPERLGRRRRKKAGRVLWRMPLIKIEQQEQQLARIVTGEIVSRDSRAPSYAPNITQYYEKW